MYWLSKFIIQPVKQLILCSGLKLIGSYNCISIGNYELVYGNEYTIRNGQLYYVHGGDFAIEFNPTSNWESPIWNKVTWYNTIDKEIEKHDDAVVTIAYLEDDGYYRQYSEYSSGKLVEIRQYSNSQKHGIRLSYYRKTITAAVCNNDTFTAGPFIIGITLNQFVPRPTRLLPRTGYCLERLKLTDSWIHGW